MRRLLADRSGNVTAMLAGGLVMLIATAGLAVDAGTFFLEKRRLQGIADAAALSAVADPSRANSGAQEALTANNGRDVHLDQVTQGKYSADTSLDAAARFQPSTDGNAVRIELSRSAPTFFGRFLTGSGSTIINARSTAARIDLAAISIGSRLAAVQGGLPNALLSGLTGSELNLSVMDYEALVSTQIDVLRLSEALRTSANLKGASFNELLDSQVTLPQALQAMAAAAPASAATSTLSTLAARVPGNPIRLSDMIDLGPLGTSVHADPLKPIEVDAWSIVRAMLETAASSRQLSANVNLNLPGLASSRVMLAIGQRPENSPWLSVGKAGEITVRTAQTRVYLDTRLSALAPLGLGQVRVPLFAELASASATLSSVSCAGGRSRATASLAVTPSIGEAAIADFDAGQFANFASKPVLRPAVIVDSALADVTAFADVRLGGTAPQDVRFTADDIAAHRVKTVSTNDVTQGVAASLIEDISLGVGNNGPLLATSLVTSTLGQLLRPVAGPLDGLLDQVTALAGVRLGQADVRVNGVRCGTPMLVG